MIEIDLECSIYTPLNNSTHPLLIEGFTYADGANPAGLENRSLQWEILIGLHVFL